MVVWKYPWKEETVAKKKKKIKKKKRTNNDRKLIEVYLMIFFKLIVQSPNKIALIFVGLLYLL